MPQLLPLSKQIDNWLKSDSPKTIGDMSRAFGKSSFAVLFIICMALPATPIPTGILTHILEVIVMLVALETIIGLKSLWLPNALTKRTLPDVVVKKALPKFIHFLERLERASRVRGARILENTWTERFAGLAVLVFAIGAFLAIPFTNLDTLASMGAVLLSLGLVLNDIIYFVAGLIIGITGVVIEIAFGTVVAHFMHRLWDHSGMGLRLSGIVIVIVLTLALFYWHNKKK